MEVWSMAERKIQLAGASNVRDLGGYPTLSGKKTKMGRFIRAAGLEGLTDSDIQILLDYGVKVNLDLRTSSESERWPDRLLALPEIAYYQVSLLDGLDLANPPHLLSELYTEALDHCKPHFKASFELMTQYLEAPFLFHCSAGKDRTGMIAALLLDLAQVDQELIIANYTESVRNLGPLIEKFAQENDPKLRAFLSSNRIDIEPFLKNLENQYGGSEGYLQVIGLSEKNIEDLRESFLT